MGGRTKLMTTMMVGASFQLQIYVRGKQIDRRQERESTQVCVCVVYLDG